MTNVTKMTSESVEMYLHICICYDVSCQCVKLEFAVFYSLFQLHYGIFLDGYTFSLLLDSYLKKKDYKGKIFGQVFFSLLWGCQWECVCVCSKLFQIKELIKKHTCCRRIFDKVRSVCAKQGP